MLSCHSGISKEEIKDILKKENCRIYFIGICGVSMSALAELLVHRGYSVAGSDSFVSRKISGCEIFRGQESGRIRRIYPSLVVYSLAVSVDNPEYREAKELGLPMASRAELMGAMMSEYKNRIAVIGSHGKSTTTAMVARILEAAELHPTVLSGADLGNGSCFLAGGSEYLVYEGCEYRESFLRFSPTVTLLLNIDLDHTDFYSGIEEIKESFTKAVNLSSDFCIINGDCKRINEIKGDIKCKLLTVSQVPETDFSYKIISAAPHVKLKISAKSSKFTVELPVFGAHNATNAAMAACLGLALGAKEEKIAQALGEFKAIPRRQQFIGRMGEADVYYDYAHHPAEIEATVNALSQCGYRRITAVFCPHTYSRTAALWDEFCRSLSKTHKTVITEIYPAREKPIIGVSGKSLAEAILKFGGRAEFLENPNEFAPDKIDRADCLVLMGAGSLDKIFKKITDAIDNG